jgi:hypothetical protein
MRTRVSTWAETATILADQFLKCRIRQGQVHILRKPRVEDDEDPELRVVNAPYLGDDL